MAWLLDFNVISEIRRGAKASPQVLAWYRETDESELYLSVLVVGEIRFGIEKMRLRDPASAQILDRWLRQVEVGFGDRILPVNREIADIWGRLSPLARPSTVDGLLATTAIHHDLVLVTRNIRDIARSGVDYFNPFAD